MNNFEVKVAVVYKLRDAKGRYATAHKTIFCEWRRGATGLDLAGAIDAAVKAESPEGFVWADWQILSWERRT